MQRKDKEDIVWALHTFEAENEDELAFEAGERIAVLERDDQFGDGWFQVRLTLCNVPQVVRRASGRWSALNVSSGVAGESDCGRAKEGKRVI